MKKTVITISRQFGSGGRSIGKEIAKKLGYDYYDSELVNKVAEKTGLDPTYIENAGEYAPGKSFLSYAFSSTGNSNNQLNTAGIVWKAQCDIILELAEKGNCVIVGRCADYILREREDCLNAFIFANNNYRANRIVNLYGEKDKTPEKRLEEKDAKRKVYYKFYTGRVWGDISNYHIALDSSAVGAENCVDIIADLAKKL